MRRLHYALAGQLSRSRPTTAAALLPARGVPCAARLAGAHMRALERWSAGTSACHVLCCCLLAEPWA